jgi:hypothetical protein
MSQVQSLCFVLRCFLRVLNWVSSTGSLGWYVMYVSRVHNKTYMACIRMLSDKVNKRIYTYEWIIMDIDRVQCEHAIDLGSGVLAHADVCVLCGTKVLYSVRSQYALNHNGQGG